MQGFVSRTRNSSKDSNHIRCSLHSSNVVHQTVDNLFQTQEEVSSKKLRALFSFINFSFSVNIKNLNWRGGGKRWKFSV